MTLADAKGQTVTRGRRGEKLIDMTGQVVGEVTVLSRGPNDKWAKVQWWCRCECGNVVLLRAGDLRRESRTQCVVCGNRRKGNTNRKPHEFIDGLEHKHCSRCKEWRPLDYFSKGTGWDGLHNECTFCKSYGNAMRTHGGNLTLEEHRAVRCQPCVLTGIVNPLHMSVDRIDSSLPYNKGNVQPMLLSFNKQKGNRDDAEFKAMVAPVVDQIRRSKPAYY